MYIDVDTLGYLWNKRLQTISTTLNKCLGYNVLLDLVVFKVM